jgi:acetyl-CoA carboxylase biotin carboxylase subunit
MIRALRELRIGGVVTTATFLDRVLRHQRFSSGRYDTHFLDECREKLVQNREHDTTIAAAFAVEVLNGLDKSGGSESSVSVSRWKTLGRMASLFRHV